jgi:hypothetical protein
LNRSLILWPTPILIGIAVALLSVLIGNATEGYGFPLVWKTGGCPPPGITASAPCLLAIGHDWLDFGLDALFYILVGFGLLLTFTNHFRRTVDRRRRHFER